MYSTHVNIYVLKTYLNKNTQNTHIQIHSLIQHTHLHNIFVNDFSFCSIAAALFHNNENLERFNSIAICIVCVSAAYRQNTLLRLTNFLPSWMKFVHNDVESSVIRCLLYKLE